MNDLITRTVLSALRKQFDMDVAFISEFREGDRVFRFVDTDDETCPVEVDGSDPLEATYCQRVVDGRLPELMRDAKTFQAARELPA
ncbi:MAG: diguanylate phosphodiesterase, partial [Acidimicrobiia bacterium]